MLCLEDVLSLAILLATRTDFINLLQFLGKRLCVILDKGFSGLIRLGKFFLVLLSCYLSSFDILSLLFRPILFFLLRTIISTIYLIVNMAVIVLLHELLLSVCRFQLLFDLVVCLVLKINDIELS